IFFALPICRHLADSSKTLSELGWADCRRKLPNLLGHRLCPIQEFQHCLRVWGHDFQYSSQSIQINNDVQIRNDCYRNVEGTIKFAGIGNPPCSTDWREV